MDINDADVEAGQAMYTRRTLQVYDLVVLGISNPLLWKCPTRRLQQHYNEHLKPLMNPGAVLFGSTILQGDLPSD
jgi:hypothetical protein